jgi:hypothetical protein
MIAFLIFVISTIGLSHIFVDGSIFSSFKTWLGKESRGHFLTWSKGKLLSLLNCYQCSGFWSGAVIGLIMWFCGQDPLHSPWDWTHVLMLFVYACAGAFLSMLAAVLLMFMQAHSKTEAAIPENTQGHD